MSFIVRIAPGEYEIGDDSIPNAGPKHRRRLTRPFWIDVLPVSWAHFEAFVTGGGYRRNGLWGSCKEASTWRVNLASVDDRCYELIEQAEKFADNTPFGEPRTVQQPITGLNWFEAAAVAAYFGARLPFEVEWEIAMGRKRNRSDYTIALHITMEPVRRERTRVYFHVRHAPRMGR